MRPKLRSGPVRLDLDHISELYRIQDGAILVLNVDAVIEHNPPVLNHHLTGQVSDLVKRVSYRRFERRQIDTIIVRDIHVIVKVEIEPRHPH